MIVGSKKGWAAAILLSIAMHLGALAFYKPPPADGTPERPAGAQLAVAGSLASVFGGAQQTEPVESTEAPNGVNPVEAPQVQRPSNVEPVPAFEPTASPVDVAANAAGAAESARQTTPAEATTAAPIMRDASIAAHSFTEAPVTEMVSPQSVETTSLSSPSTVSAAKSEAAIAQPSRRAAKRQRRLEEHRSLDRRRRHQRAQRKKRVEQRRRLEQNRRAEQKRRADRRRRERARRTQERHQAARRSRAGTSSQGAAGRTRGGRRGRSRVSAGAVRSYGSRVRARILANRPSASGAGVAVVSFDVSSGGRLRYARVVRSSGNPSLDRAAVSAVRRSSPFPRPPAGASAGQLRFSISFSFR